MFRKVAILVVLCGIVLFSLVSCRSPNGKNFKKTIKIGTGFKTGYDFLEALESKNVFVSHNSEQMLDSSDFTIAPEEKSIKLFAVTGRQLGIKDEWVRLDDIYAKAIEKGFLLCPAEAGPQLRLQYLNQPIGQPVYIAMKPIYVRTSRWRHIFTVFCMDNNGSRLTVLGDTNDDPKDGWSTDTPFTFMRN